MTPTLRDYFLRALVLGGVGVWVSTESLGALHLIRRGPLAIFWILLALALALMLKRSGFTFPPVRLTKDPIILICIVAVTAILTLTGITAAFSPPNSADAMAYHMPRVIYWAQRGSVAFFPTPYFNQIMLQPMAEYMMLQSYVLSGGDRFINFGQWLASLGSIAVVSSIARELGASGRGQALAALFCATLPAGILAGSGAKNDYVLAAWLAIMVYFALRFARQRQTADALFPGAALGLALFTKATAYLFAPWLLAAILLPRRLYRPLILACLIAFSINAPQYARNYQLSGSIMGFDSAQGDGYFRWRNETFGWRQTTSNILRNLSDQLGARSTRWNEGVYQTVTAIHNRLGIDIDDPATTWRESKFGPPVNANHEANAPNRLHLAILLVVCCLLGWRDRARALYTLALLCGFVAFCGYLKWQPFFARLLLPLFVLSAPLTATVSRTAIQVVMCILLIDTARPAVLENWVRPLKGPRSVLHTNRDEQYFADMSQWDNRESYMKTVDLLASRNCDSIGIDITNLTLEYPLQALLRERKPRVRFIHTGVQNVSVRYRSDRDPEPCAVVCLDCLNDSKRLALYSDFPVSEAIGKFVIFSQHK